MSDPVGEVITSTWLFIKNLIISINQTLNLPQWIDNIAISVVKSLVLILLITLDLLFIVWMERKVLGRLHHRRSVTETGPVGFFQNIADFIKFLIKEDIVPDKADRFFHHIVPVLYTTLAFLPLALIPFAPGLWITNIGASLLAVLAIASLLPSLVIVGGWAGGSKFSLIGAFRAGLLMIAYEIPIAITALSIATTAGSLNLAYIAEAQKNIWFIFIQPLAAFIFVIAGTMEMERAPFDITEAESELTVGWKTEFTGIKFALLYAGQYFQLFVTASLFTILFLGGWYGPFLHPLIWFIIKVHLVILLFIIIRVTYFRPRPDQIVKIGFKWLTPLSIINLFYTVFLVTFLPIPL
ncbi:MAG: NADH-quinone oxidoreductase subunit NuoH [Candidatus Njordarchaeia archaeon]